jgi:hypothetical protein
MNDKLFLDANQHNRPDKSKQSYLAISNSNITKNGEIGLFHEGVSGCDRYDTNQAGVVKEIVNSSAILKKT